MTTTSNEHRGLTAAQRALALQRLRGVRGGTTDEPMTAPPGAPVPLSPVQRGLWLVEQFLDDNSLYGVHRSLWLRGELDVAALRAGLDRLVARHETLRTTYAGDTLPLQQVAATREADFRVTDLTGLPAPETRQRALDLAAAELRTPFDLATGPTLRARLFRTAAAEHLLVLNMHHLVSDAWSCTVLGRDLGELYASEVAGRAPELPALPVQYGDYAYWQVRRLAGRLRDEQLGYWRSVLDGIDPVLRLPADRRHPARPSYRAGRVRRSLDAELTAAARRLAQERGVTLFSLLLTAFAVVLGRCAGQDRFAVGSLTSGRERPEVEHLIGMFANTVAIPVDLSGNPTFGELLQGTRQAVLGALGHQDVSFEDVVAAVRPEREPGRSPLFQVLFQLVAVDDERWRFGDLDVRTAETHNGLGKVDLALYGIHDGGRLDLEIEYAHDVFDHATAVRYAERVATVLEQVVRAPDAPLSTVDVMPPAERELVVRGLNDTAAEVPWATLGELFEAAARRVPDARAVVDTDGSVTTYAELNARANRLAHHLRDRGVGCESVVGVCLESGVDQLAALLAVVKSGGAYLPLDPDHPADRLGFVLADTGARVVVTAAHLAGALPRGHGGDLVLVDDDRAVIEGSPATDPVVVNGPDNLVYVMYTSGSTGRPKGVMISHHGLVNYLWWAIDGYGLDGASGAPMLGSIAVDLSVPNFFLPLIGGKDVTLLPPDRSLSALGELLARPGDFSLLKLTPGHLDLVRATLAADSTVDSVRTFVVGADEVRPETVAAWREVAPGARIIDEYGPTETVVGCSTYLVDEDFDPARPVPIGKPIANTRMYVLDRDLNPVPLGVTGELCIGGFGVARGYWRRPGLTAEKFVPDPSGPAGTRMYRTGDLARFRGDGNLEFLGRSDHQVKIRGYRVELGEVEATLLSHERVSEAVVDARPDLAGHQRLVAYLVAPSGPAPDVAELREFAAAALPEYMVPGSWVLLDRLPLTRAGKVDRTALPDPGPAGNTAVPGVAPRTETERVLAEAWAHVLDIGGVGVHDDFFRLGGDSILAVQVVGRVRQAGVPVTLRQVFEHRTIAALAAEAGPAERQPVRIPARPPDEPVPLSPVQHGLWVVDQFLADNSLYSVHRALWLRGTLDVTALRQAIDGVVRRHEVLRTTYAGVTEPVVVIGAARTAAFDLVDVSGDPAAARERAVELAEGESRRPFDLTGGPLFRATLVRVGDDEHLLVLNLHHLVTDGWTVLARELGERYAAAVRGAEPAVPDLAVQYADYARWQADRISGEVRERQLAYWRDALGAVAPVLRLPTDRPHPAVPSYRAGTAGHALSAELTAAMRRLAQDRGVTLFSLLLAALAVVLRRCGGEDRFAIGSLVSGRDRADLDDLIGMFANTVAIPADLAGDPMFTELLDRTQRTMFAVLENQDVSFEDVVAAVRPDREAGRNPLFQVLLQLFRADDEQWRLAGLEVDVADLGAESGKVDLSVFAVDRGELVELELHYASDVFDQESAERMVARLAATLAQVVADPGVRVSGVDVMAPAERELVVRGWNDTAAEVPRATLAELFEAAAARVPAAAAVVDVDGSVVTYAELNARANRLAHHLRARGVAAESVVGVCFESGVDTLVALLGVVKSGAAYLPLDPGHPADRLAFMLADTAARLVVTRRRFTGALPGEFDGSVVLLDDDRPAIDAGPDSNPAPVNGPDNLVYVMYTSGSTGRPKGVMISHHGLVNYLWWAIDGYGLDGASGAPMLGSIAVDLSVPNFFLPLIGGKDVTLLPPDRSLSTLAGLLSRPGDFSLLKLTPGHLDVLRAELGDGSTVDSVRTFVVGADEVRPETVVAWRKIAPEARIIDEYGPTETVVGCSTYLVDDGFDPSRPVSIGKPIANTRMHVLDEALDPVPIGVAGELYIGGSGVARGYWRRAALTAEKFVPDPFGTEPGARLYRTGDLARFRGDGNLEFLGRIDHQVKIRGYRVELGEIEARLLLHDRVSEAVVTARPDPAGHKRLAAYLVPVAGSAPTHAELHEFLAAALPGHMVPATFTALDRMPLSPAGKVDRDALPDPDRTVPAGTAHLAPRTQNERLLTEIWTRVLGIDRVGVHDEFFELGGDSILAIHIAGQARQAGLHLTVRQLFEHRTIAALGALAGRPEAAPVRAEQGVVTGAVPLTPILRWFTDHHGGLDHYNQSVVLECTEPVGPAALSAALSALVAHHDALRLRLFRQDGSWRAEVTPVRDHELLRVVDLTGVPADERSAACRRVADEVQSGLSVADGRLVAAALFTGDDGNPDRLLIAVHHIAVDTVSWTTLLADLATACRRHEAGQPVRLPRKTTSYQEWARRVSRDELPASGTPLPGHGTEESTRTVDVEVPAELTEALLRQVPAAYRTEIDDVLLTALARTLTEWTGEAAVTVDLEGHGREPESDDVDLSRTVGWFTSLRPVTLPAAAGGWGAHLKAVKQLLRSAPPRETPPAALASFNYAGRIDPAGAGGGRFRALPGGLGADRSGRASRPYPLDINAAVRDGRLQLSWGYSHREHDRAGIHRLATAFTRHLADLVGHCVGGAEGATPSDFPLAGLDQETLDGLLARLRDGRAAVRAADVEDVYPLTPLQHGMLFRSLYDADSEDYFEQNGFVVRAGLTVDKFVAAWQQVVDRHAALRTLFAWEGLPRPVQVVLRGHRIRVDRLDWTGLAPAAVPAEFDRLMRADRAAGFDLTAECPCRLTLVTTAPDEHHVLWSFHHAVLDAWSVSTVLDEVFAAYRSLEGDRVPEPAEVVPYRDHVAWIERQDRAADERFWRAELAGRTGSTVLPAIPPVDGGPGVDRVHRRLPAGLADRVRRLAVRCECTVGTVLQAAWALALSRYTGETDVLFGTVVAGRAADLPGIERMVGMLANTLPTRVAVDPEARVVDYLAARHGKQLELREHEHSALADIRQWTDFPPYTALFDHIFSYENFMSGGQPADGPEIEARGEFLEQTDCPLVLDVADHDTIELVATYHRARFGRDTCARLLGHIEHLVLGMVEAPESALRQLDILPPAERETVLREWNDTGLAVPRSTLGELFEAAVRRAPGAVAVVDVDGSVATYGEVNARSNRLAHLLRDRGVGCESVVGVCVESGVDLLVALLGVVKSGGAYLPLDPEHPADRLGYMLSDTAAGHVVTQQAVAAVLPTEFAGAVVLLDGEPSELTSHPDTDPVPVNGPDNLVYVMYTSGSTGRPKGVMISHHGLVNYLWWAIDGYGLDGASGAPMVGSIAVDLSVPNFFLPLIGGKDVTLLRKDRGLSALAELLSGPGDFSLLKLTPGHLDVLRAELGEGSTVDSVRTFVVGADEVRPETVVAWRKIAPEARIIDEYGPTETVVGCSTYVIGQDFDPAVPVSIGRPIANTRMYVLDEWSNPVPVGVAGELCIGGSGVARGYWRRPGLTAEKFVPEPFGPAGSRMYRTGDLARYRANGDLEFLGRADHQVKIRGHRVELGEIEARLSLHPGVSEAVVTADADSAGNKRLAAYVVAHPGRTADPDELRAFAATTLPGHMVPARWTVLDRMPLTQAGKVDRTALPDPDGPAAAGTTHLAPRTGTERLLAEVWARVLGVDRVGVHDDFFALGGDSILAIQVVARLRQDGTPVILRQVFECRTIARLAEAVDAGVAVPVRAEQGVVTGPVPLTPILHWFTEVHGGLDHYNQAVLLECRALVPPELLSAALSALVAHHDALRTRLFRQDGSWRAEVTPVQDRELLEVVDLSGLPAGESERTCTEVAARIQSGLSLEQASLVRAALFTGAGNGSGRLFIAIHHIAVDTVSWNILLEDLTTACAQLTAGRSVRLPAKTSSFADWASRLSSYVPTGDTRHPHTAHTALPVDHDRGPNTEESARSVEVSLPAEVTAELEDVAAGHGTEINDVLVAALARTLTEWTGEHRITVDLEGHGREPLFDDIDLTRTVGWFTTIRPVEFLLPDGGWAARLDAVKARLRADPHNGIGYGVSRYLRGADTAATDSAQVSFNYHGRLDRQRAGAARFVELPATLAVERDPLARRPYDIDVDAAIAEGRLGVSMTYSANLHRQDTVARLAQRYLGHVRALVTHCRSERPAAFPLSGLDGAALERVRSEGIEDIYRLSPLQAGMLVETLLTTAEDPYYLQWNFDIEGDLDTDAFVRAWQFVVDRHAVLRTRFAWEGLPHPVQLVHAAWPVEVHRWDARSIPEEDRAAWLDRLVADERADGIDLHTAPPTRLVLVRTGERRHRLIWNSHHIQLDRWSRTLVETEVFAAYQALTGTGDLPRLPAPVPYRDFVASLGRSSGGEAYWRAVLADFPGSTPAPGAGHPGGPATMAVTDLVLPAELTTGVRHAARRYGVTANVLAQATWALLLAGASGRHDVVFDLTVAGRSADTPGVERIVGMLINTVPARTRVDPSCGLGTWLRQVHDQQVRRYPHEHHSLVDIHRWAGLTGSGRLSDTRFVFEAAATEEATGSGGLTVEPLGEVNGDIEHTTVLAVSSGRDWLVQLRYDSARYRPEAADELLAEYVSLLRAVVTAEPAAALGTLTDLSEVDSGVAAVAGRASTVQAHVAPATPDERALAEIWTRLLGVDRPGAHEDFFALGGNSLLAFQVAAQAQSAGLDLTVRQVLQHRTIAELAGALTGGRPRPAAAHPPLTPALHELTADGEAWPPPTSVLVPWRPAADVAGALRAVVARHDALRLRLTGEPGDRRLDVADVEAARPRVLDLTGHHDRPDPDPVAAGLAAGLDPVRGPLLGAALLPDGTGCRLLLVAHRIAVDASSWPILVADLAAAARGEELPGGPSYRDWARRLDEYAGSAAFAEASAFWLAPRPDVARLPVDHPDGRNTTARSVRTVRPAAAPTGRTGYRIDEILLAAVAHALAGWTGSADVLIDVRCDGREPVFDDLDLTGAIGAFESTHPVRLHLPDGGPSRRLAAVAAQVRAEPHGAVGHGLARRRPDTAAAAAGRRAAQVLLDTRVGPHRPADRDDAPHLVTVDAEVADGQLVLRWGYFADVHDETTIDRVAGACADELARLAAAAASSAARGPGPADRLAGALFPHAPALLVPMTRHRVPGVSVAVVADGRITAWGQGSTGGEDPVPVTAGTLFPACSVSKHVTTLAVLRLVQEGHLDLDEDVRHRLSSWRPPAGEPVPLRALLSHTAGLAAGRRREYLPGCPVPELRQVLDRIVRDRPVGSGFHYSNAHFAVIQQLLADVTGRPAAEALRSLVLDPLGMTDSGFECDFAESWTGPVAYGHERDGRPYPHGWRVTAEVAGSGLWTTARDLAKVQLEVLAAVGGGPTAFLGRELAELMVTPVAGEYGFGTACSRGTDAHWFGHPGERNSHQSFTAADLRTGAGIVVLANLGGDTAFLADLVNQLRLDIHYMIG
ncbi:amino acid adenylation domain-containing protein [Amycolatopsis sp. NPDC005003]